MYSQKAIFLRYFLSRMRSQVQGYVVLTFNIGRSRVAGMKLRPAVRPVNPPDQVKVGLIKLAAN